jgi:hypothetical protein
MPLTFVDSTDFSTVFGFQFCKTKIDNSRNRCRFCCWMVSKSCLSLAISLRGGLRVEFAFCLLRFALCGSMPFNVLFQSLADDPRRCTVQVSGNALCGVPQLIFHSQSANRRVHAWTLVEHAVANQGPRCTHR